MARIVLVADDSPTIQKRAVGILKGEGFEVETVSNGVAAIKRLAVLRPVAVLADVSMPGRDGYEVCDFVKKSPDLCHVPVLLVASDMEPYNSAKGTEVRADGIIKKPFEARELISIVVKFAEQFESATIAIPGAAAAPAPAPEPKQELAATGNAPDNTPTIVQHEEPDFSAQAGGVAFAEPIGEEAPAFSFGDHLAGAAVPFGAPQEDAAPFSGPAFDFPTLHADEQPLAAEAPRDPHSFEPPPPHRYSSEVPSFPEGAAATTPGPVFADEQPGHASVPPNSSSAMRTAIFHTPLEIAQPSWMDEAAPTSPQPEPAEPTALEPQFIREEPDTSSESPHEHPHEQPHEHMHFSNSVRSTSLDSFSLDDAAAGQVRFASELPEVVYASPNEEAAATEPELPTLTPEVISIEATAPESTSDLVYSKSAVPEPAPEVVYAEASAAALTPEAVQTEVTPPEPAAGAIGTESATLELAPEIVPEEVASPKFTPEVIYADADAYEPAPETVNTEATADAALAEPVHAESIPVESTSEAVRTEAAQIEPVAESVHAESAPVESTPEVVHTEIASDEHLVEPVHAESASVELEPEATHPEIHLPATATEMTLAGIASVGAAVEAIHEGIAHHETSPEVIPHQIAAAESVPEAIHPQEGVAEPTAEVTPSEPASEVAAPQPAIDRELVLCIIEKVVLKMAPPMLTADAVQEIIKRLTQEIVAEISIESSRPKD